MSLDEEVKINLFERIEFVRQLQTPNGSWDFCFEGPIITDCFMIILLRDLNSNNEEVIQRLVEKLLSLQLSNGAWSIYEDELEGDLSATIQAYVALLFSGSFSKEHPRLKQAERFILSKGGLNNAHFMTKMMLAFHGYYHYPPYFYFPMSYFLLPASSPFNLFELSNYARVHLVPMIICINKRFTLKYESIQNLDNLLVDHEQTWFREDRFSFFEWMKHEMKELLKLPSSIHQLGIQTAEKFMLDRIESNGTLYSYASSTFYMIYALLALGYNSSSKIIGNAVNGLFSYLYNTDKGLHLQNSPSTVWDTSLLSYALQEAGVPYTDPMINSSISYLLEKQHVRKGDWSIHAKNLEPGGWGFSDVNHFIPDNDDTSASLRAIFSLAQHEINTYENWEKGYRWLIGMQNKDGGFGAFEKNVTNKWLTHLPLESASDAIIDPSTADLTGRVLEFFGNFAGLQKENPNIKAAIHWLLKHQEKNGSWYGRWGVCYIYGTWAAVTGLRAVGVPTDHPSLQKSLDWLISIQREDGGFGESCRSCEVESYVDLPFSTPSQTAWAIDTLLTLLPKEHPAIEKGVLFLLNQHNLDKQSINYPTGLGLPGNFYTHYHSYQHIFPILALGHYLKN